MLSAVITTEIRLPHTKIELPKLGASTRLPTISRDINTAPLRKTTRLSSRCAMLVLPIPVVALRHQRHRLEQPGRDAVDELRRARQHDAQGFVVHPGRIAHEKILLGAGRLDVEQ